MPGLVAFVAAAEIAAGGKAEQKARHGIAAGVVPRVRIALRVAAREIEVAVVIARRRRSGANETVFAAHLHPMVCEVARHVALHARRLIARTAAVAGDANTGCAAARRVVLIHGDAGQVHPRQILKAERGAIEFLGLTLLDVLAEPGVAAAQVQHRASPDQPYPVGGPAAVDARLRPLALVRGGSLEAVGAAELIAMVVVNRHEDLAGVGEVMVDAGQLGVVVVARLVHRVDEVVEALP